MVLGSLAWLLPVSLIVTISFGIVVLGLSVCWWLIFKRTVRRFNLKGKDDAR
ncbi:hypothetical protein [Lactiplantibacillus mudanjiangensis]|uniref:Uncharacterized protein n=1 Tax=Lactiplantibacillus mudanjiangensis TaxID=1296538 RepID=A0A660E298_9LACO|nr:hypothetical protein [Lactiplantibacillus mudanjiangensis]VDG19067.1 hypothetical protein [Lactobacillus zymae] [Lactiplantibacillus mudanjiangensis]VDG23215.1 hypothetical protein [Lactobacillus zymae] [Lactiplantibacillus mudanjiangensis]VDG29859.1 hypothetical protein [Lactobacillus zymae] [Lactiplantibacillus mudanjiangensis]VDG33157.1 hypothetical protein [Lactobacillus zymae] [Lactiplantibacillus mudanjiangensis]